MAGITTVGPDLAKNAFQGHGADPAARAVPRKTLRRDQVLAFVAERPRCVVTMGACGGGHFGGRELARLGHDLRLSPPARVKSLVKRRKDDAADAEVILPTHRAGPERDGAAIGVYRQIVVRDTKLPPNGEALTRKNHVRLDHV